MIFYSCKTEAHFTKAICEHCLYADHQWWQHHVSQLIVACKLQINLSVLQSSCTLMHEVQVCSLFWLVIFRKISQRWNVVMHVAKGSLRVADLMTWAPAFEQSTDKTASEHPNQVIVFSHSWPGIHLKSSFHCAVFSFRMQECFQAVASAEVRENHFPICIYLPILWNRKACSRQ